MTEPNEEEIRDLVPVPTAAPPPSVWHAIREQAAVLLRSGFLPDTIRTPEQATAIIMQGRELGLGPMASFTGINVIRGRPSLSAGLMLALIKRSGLLENIEMIPSGAEEYTVTMKRKGEEPHAEKFTLKMARDLGLGVGDPKSQWSHQPMNMLKQRALSACARVVFPDVLLGLYTTEEVESFQPATPRPYVDAEWAPVADQYPSPTSPPSDPEFLSKLETMFAEEK